MNDLTPSLLTAMIQITLVGLPTAAVVWMIGRRCAAASATLALAGLSVAALLSAAAFVPLPSAWTWSSSAELSTERVETRTGNVADSSAVPAVDLGELFALLRRRGSAVESAGWTWSSAIAIGIVALLMASVARLFAGLIAVRNLRRRSEITRDPTIRDIADKLAREIGVRRSVELRASSGIGSAAACGWRHPAILLAADWPSWSSVELRAVLAHELAHIQRRDFLLGIVARICLTLCVHHPLAVWLTSRLRLAQEIAADELAAIASGGRECYRRALARMALRQDSAWLGGMAQTFGTNRNSFTRRLAMLSQGNQRPMGRILRCGLLGCVVAVGVIASAVRGTAEPPTAEAPAAAALPAFDLGYLHGGCEGFIAIRPSLLLSRPDMKPIHDSLSKSLHSILHAMGLPANCTIPLDEIEQMVGPIELKTFTEEEMKRQPNSNRHALTMGIMYVRMTRDYDWAKLLRSLPKIVRVTEKQPGVFEVATPLFGPEPMTVRVLDSRTIVGSSASASEASENRIEIAERFGARMIEQANQSGLAIAIDSKKIQFTEKLKAHPEVGSFVSMLENPSRLAVYLHWSARASATAFAQWDMPEMDKHRADAIIRGTVDAWRQFGKSLSEKSTDEKDKKLADLIAKSTIAVSAGSHRRTEGHAEIKLGVSWPEIFGIVMENATGSVEVKQSKTKD